MWAHRDAYRAEDLNRAVRHDFKVDLKAGFKVILTTKWAQAKAVVGGWLPRWREFDCSRTPTDGGG